MNRTEHEELLSRAADLEMRRADAAAAFDHAQEQFWLECLEDITYLLREAEHNAAAAVERPAEYDHDERGSWGSGAGWHVTGMDDEGRVWHQREAS